MNEANSRIGQKAGRVLVASLSQLDEMVGELVMGNCPEVAWQDSYGLFLFSSRLEAEEAINNNYYRLFRPDLDWENATVQEVRHFPLYSLDLGAAWSVVERLSAENKPAEIRRQGEIWRAAFSGTEAFAHTPALAICLAALRALGIDPIFCEALLEEDPGSRIDTPQGWGLPLNVP